MSSCSNSERETTENSDVKTHEVVYKNPPAQKPTLPPKFVSSLTTVWEHLLFNNLKTLQKKHEEELSTLRIKYESRISYLESAISRKTSRRKVNSDFLGGLTSAELKLL